MVGAGLLVAACGSESSDSGDAADLADSSVDEGLTVSSEAWTEGTPIPVKYSCDGDDVSPPLAWEGVPDDAVELAVVVDDPDAGGGPFVHWVLFGLDPSVTSLDEGQIPDGALEAKTGFGKAGWGGPCPPEADDAHGYRFTVYALDAKVDADDGADFGDVLGDVKDAAIAKGTLVGTFDH